MSSMFTSGILGLAAFTFGNILYSQPTSLEDIDSPIIVRVNPFSSNFTVYDKVRIFCIS